MKQRFFIALFLAISCSILSAQCVYATLLAEGQSFYNQGKYRDALRKYNAARICDPSKSMDIDKEVNKLFDAIDNQRMEALANEKKVKEGAQKVLALQTATQTALRQAQIALDSLNIVLDNLGKANADKVRLILADVARNQRELNFDAAVDKLKTASILRALPDSVAMAYQSLSRSLLSQARQDLQRQAYQPALANIQRAGALNVQPDSVVAANQALRHFLFENARLDILHTAYDTALKKIQALQTLQVPADTVESLYFEIAFCFTETGRLDRAAALLDTIAQLRHNNAVRTLLRELAGKEAAQKARLLRQARQQLDPQRNNRLLALYTPADFATIPAGTLMLGGDESQGACPVNIAPFRLCKKEVTFSEYDLFCAATSRPKPSDNGWGRGERPVIDVDWYDAAAYCNWRSQQEGLQEVYAIDQHADNKVTGDWSANGYRLPTEAEWEFAAGNGEKHTRYSWGNAAPAAQNGGNVADETTRSNFPAWEIFGGYADGFVYTAPTGSYAANDFGLYDMTGNVWEWCWDGYEENYCRANRNRKILQSPTANPERVLRSGSWGSFPKDCSVGNRFHNQPDTRNFSIGFRLARN